MALALSVTGYSPAAFSADTTDDITIKRVRSGLSAGIDVVHGNLGFASETVNSEIQLTAMPAVSFGLDLWPEEHIGLYVDGYFGTGATIDGVLDAEVPITTMEYHLGGRYRWFLGHDSRAIAWGLGLSVHGFHQWVQDQRPAVLLDRVIIGPRMTPFLTVPLFDGDFWVRSGVFAEHPFFVREAPSDSGNPMSFFAWGAQIQCVQSILPRWGVQLQGEFLTRSMEFDGLGTRGAGIENGTTADRFLRFGVAIRYLTLEFENEAK